MTTLWKQLQADYQRLVATDSSPTEPTSITPSLLSLADFQKLAPLLEQGRSLFEVLTFPLAELTTFQQPFTTIATRLLQHHQAKTQQAPTLIQTVTVLGQAAYLDQLRATLAQPKIQQWLARVGDISATAAIQQQFGIVKALKLEERDARQAIVSFPTSRLASVLNRLLMVRLEQLEVQSAAANQVAIRIALKTEEAMLPALAQMGEAMLPWVNWYREDETADHLSASLERHLRIDAYLDECIAPLPNELVFNESFNLREIYVPLKAQPLTCEGEPDFDQPPVALEDWAIDLLNDETQQDQVLLVQGSFGRGKTTFCRLFADWVRQHQHPRWTPVLISLQEIGAIEKDFEAFLQQAVDPHLTQADPDWLVHGDVRFLFFLDGFSELHLDDQASSLEQFFQQVGKFQETCANHPDMGHRMMMTGRSVVLKTLERLLPRNLKRVEILPLDADLHDRWLAQWERLTGAHTSGLKQILHHPDLPEHSQELMGEPLMLYFLAAMHRDGALRLDSLRGTNFDRAKFLLYQQIFYWALTKHRPGLLNRDLTHAETEDLRRLLTEAGLWMVQTGSESVPLASLSERFPSSDTIQALIEALQGRLQHHALTNPLVTFYSGSESQKSGDLRFTHNSFGKLFASHRLHETLEDWSHTLTRRHRSEPLIDSESLHWQLFDLLGCDRLTPEITNYLMVLLNANPEFDLAGLFNRLEDFYLRWCAGQFVDAPPENFPQKEMRLMRQHRPSARFGAQFGQRQIDIYTGLNVMILLLQLHGYARSHADLPDDVAVFHPCGRQGMPEFEPERLLRIIGYSHCVSPSAFRTIVGPYLNSANLGGVNLSGVNLSGVNLSGADLRSADVSGTNLRGASLGRANLVGASLEGANLSNADLRGANMIGAYLRGADLSSALLSGADLSSANLIGASLSRADLRDADLSGAYLRGASLQSADLNRSYLIGASLIGACLSDADLSQVDLSEANLHGADLSEANLRNADLTNADLIGADLNGATLCDAILCNASLNSADLIEADLCGADLSSANLIGADLSNQSAGMVRWSERTKWTDVRGLESAISVPEALKQQLGLTELEP